MRSGADSLTWGDDSAARGGEQEDGQDRDLKFSISTGLAIEVMK